MVLAHFPSQGLFGCLLSIQAYFQSSFGHFWRSDLRDYKPLASNRLAARVHRIAQPGHQLYTGSTWASLAARQRFLSDVPFGRFPEPSLAMYPLVRFDGASLAMYPLCGFDGASSSTYPCYRRPSFAARTPYRQPSLAEGIEKLEPSCYRQRLQAALHCGGYCRSNLSAL